MTSPIEKVYLASSARRCAECGEVIAKGELYRRVSYPPSGDVPWQTYRYHSDPATCVANQVAQVAAQQAEAEARLLFELPKFELPKLRRGWLRRRGKAATGRSDD